MASQEKAPVEIKTRKSTCLCGSVSVAFTGQEKGAVLCHCSNCKAASGSAFMHNFRFVKSEVKVLKGEDVLKRYDDKDTKSGAILYRHFCGNCGSPLWLSNNKFPGFAAANAGNLEGQRERPFTELFPENKYAWIGEVVKEKEKL